MNGEMAFMLLKLLTWASGFILWWSLKEYRRMSRPSSSFTLLEVAIYSWHLSMCYFLGPFLCFLIQMVVPKGALSLLIKWEGIRSFKICREWLCSCCRGLSRLTSKMGCICFWWRFSMAGGHFSLKIFACALADGVFAFGHEIQHTAGTIVSWDLFG